MKILVTMLKKEFLEIMRNYKLLVVPIVFVLLGAMQPITYYYMPDILEMATLPEGAILQIPLPTPGETMVSVYSQIYQIGLIVLILISMGAIANEVKNGVYETIFVKPVSTTYYILSKWVSYYFLTIVSIFVGVFIGLFYTSQLIGNLPITLVLQSSLLLIVYMLFAISLTLFFSSLTTSAITAGGMTILVSIFLSIISSLPLNFWWLPSYLIKVSSQMLYQLEMEYLWQSTIIAIGYIILILIANIYIFKAKAKF